MVGKTFVVIGSNCFTGSHIVDALVADPDRQVIGVSRSPEYRSVFLPYGERRAKNFHFRQIDVVHEFDHLVQLLEEVKPSVVINVAALGEVALSNHMPVEYFAINTLAVVKLANYLRSCSYLERYVHISSAEIFGTCRKPANEDTLFKPSTPYAVSKAAADMYLNAISNNLGFPATLIRSTNVYGKHQQLFKIIPRTVIYLKMGKTIELHGGGKAIKSFVHIRDVVRGLVLAIECDKSGTYHFTSADDYTIAEIVGQICGLMGYDFGAVTTVVGERLGQDARYWLDSSKATRELGWSPTTLFQDGLAEVVDWVNENWAEIKTEPLDYIHKT